MPQKVQSTFPGWMKAALFATVLILLSVGLWFVGAQQQLQRQSVEATLRSIASLKVRQIASWRAEKIADADILADRRALTDSIQEYLSNPTELKKSEIVRRLRPVRQRYHFADVFIVNMQKEVKLSLASKAGLYSEYASAVDEAFAKRHPVWTPLHFSPGVAFPHISLVTPLFSQKEENGSVGAVVLVADASQFLYPFIQSWPTSSKTAETLLVRKDGDDVLFLNELHHKKDTALKYRIPLSRTDLPAAMAINGVEGIVEGKDYRGVEVIAAILPVPESPWFMISKIDMSEAFAEWRFRSIMIAVFILGSLALVAAVVFILRQRNLKAHYRALYQSENALSQALKRHGIILQAIGDAVISTDAEGRVDFMNPVAEALTGWRQGEARGRKLQEVFFIVNENTREPVEDPVAKVLKEGAVVGLANHTLLLARDGREIPIADSGSPIRDEKENIIGVVLVFKDQSSERQYRNTILEREEKYRLLADNTLDVIWTMNMDLEFTYVNPAIRQLTGFTPEEWIGTRLTEHCDEKAFSKMAEIITREIAKGQEHAGVVFEVEILRKDKSVLSVEIHGRLIFDELGKPVMLQGTTRDICERKQNEKARLQEEKKYKIILQTTVDGFWLTDLHGRILEVNDAYCRMSGYREQELLSMHIPEVEGNLGSHEVASKIEKVIRKGGDRFDTRHRKKDGSLYDVEVSVQYLPTENGRLVIFLRDITMVKEAEKEKELLQAQLLQAQKMESVGRLAGGVAHDFNNMLSVILGYGELALEQTNPAQQLHTALQEIMNAARRSADITRQLLAFARKQTISPRVIDMNKTIAGMTGMLQRLIGEDIDLAWSSGKAVWSVMMDPGQIDQILVNLCVNARDAITDVGKVTIETGKAEFDETYCKDHLGFLPGEYVLLAVSDNGSGMSAEILNNIFDPFFTTKESGKGTGMGLATVYGIVKQNNGFINVYSEPDHGTTFKIYLPRHRAEANFLSEEEKADPAARGNETILLVEDEPAILKMTTTMLEKLGYTVAAARTPEEAIAHARGQGGQIHLLVTDVVMPEMNGRDLAKRILDIHPNLKRLFMSGYTANVIAHHGVLDEGVNFIQKPFSKEQLGAKVREALDGDKN